MPFLLEGGSPGAGSLLLEGGPGALLLEGELLLPVEADMLGFNADYRIIFGIDTRTRFDADARVLYNNEG